MPLITDYKTLFFKLRTIYFADRPEDVNDIDSITYMYCREKVDIEGFRRETLSTLVVDLTKGLDTIWNEMEGDCRKYIKRAEKEGFIIHKNKNYTEFIDMNKAFRKSKGLEPYYYTESFLKKYCTLYTAELNGQLLCGYVAINDRMYMRGLQAASRRLEKEKNLCKMISFGNRMLVWEAMKEAYSKGIAKFDLGGYYVGDAPPMEMDNINRFKRGFGGELTELHSYFKDYSKILSILKNGIKTWYDIRGYR